MLDVESGRTSTVEVASDKTLLDVLNGLGFDVPYNCHAGKCGICVVNVRGGEVDHKGSALSELEKSSAMLSCVSRGKGKISVEIE